MRRKDEQALDPGSSTRAWPVRNLIQKPHRKKYPELDMEHKLDYLGPLEVGIPHSCVIRLQAGNGDISFSVVEALNAHWIRGEVEEKHKGPENRKAPGKKKHVLPRHEGSGGDVTEVIIDERRED